MGLSPHKCLNPARAWKARAGFRHKCWDNPSSTKTNAICMYCIALQEFKHFSIPFMTNFTTHIPRYVYLGIGVIMGNIINSVRICNINLLIIFGYFMILSCFSVCFLQYGSLAGPFGPVVDGPGSVLPDTPQNLRANNQFMKMKIMAGVTTDEGSYYASKNINYNIRPC